MDRSTRLYPAGKFPSVNVRYCTVLRNNCPVGRKIEISQTRFCVSVYGQPIAIRVRKAQPLSDAVMAAKSDDADILLLVAQLR